jgi:hypothetical protein
MKTLCLALLIPAVLFGISTTAGAADWVHYLTDGLGDKHYRDKQGITVADKGAVTKVWVKVVYSEEGKSTYIESHAEGGIDPRKFSDLAYSIIQWSIRCGNEEHSLSSLADYDTKDRIIRSVKIKDSDGTWESIIRDSATGALYEIVCRTVKGRKQVHSR